MSARVATCVETLFSSPTLFRNVTIEHVERSTDADFGPQLHIN